MNEQEIQQDRELVNIMLSQNFREYGDLLPPGVTTDLEIPYYYSQRDENFSLLGDSSNFIRFEAYLRENDTFSPYFLNPTDFIPPLKLKKNTRPLFLEQKALDDSFDLVPYYPISAFENVPSAVQEAMKEKQGDEENLRAFLEEHPSKDERERFLYQWFASEKTADSHNLEEILESYAKDTHHFSEIDARSFASFTLRKLQLSTFSPSHPLFNESEIKHIEAHQPLALETYAFLAIAELTNKVKQYTNSIQQESTPPKSIVTYDYLCKKDDLPHFRETLANDAFDDLSNHTSLLDTYAVYPPALDGKYQDTIASTVGGFDQVSLPKAALTERSSLPDTMAWFSSSRPPDQMTNEAVLCLLPFEVVKTLKDIGDHSYDSFSMLDKPDFYHEAGTYYISYANLLAPEDPTDSDHSLLDCAVKKMEKDGIPKEIMEYILKASPKPELAESLSNVLQAENSPAR